ncbi:MAG: septum formation inhibitor Maf [Actinomycetia bacterium]|nr:septum formation inhibitor Maf [Actinomycetes bacterium]
MTATPNPCWQPSPQRSCPVAEPALVLASASPRRHELLARIVDSFDIVSTDVDETPLLDEEPTAMVERLAISKAEAGAAARTDAVVLGADTTVALDGQAIGKPVDPADARRILQALSGRTHEVHTAVAMAAPARPTVVRTVTAAVTFADLGAEEIDWYVATGEPMGKAGAYAIQGAGAVLVERVVGDPSTVIGLPMRAVSRLLGAR